MAIAERIAVGQELPPLEKEPSQRRIDVYSGVRPRSIHTDPAWAEAKGFRAPLAQGMMSTAYASEMMTRLLGPGFLKGGTLSMAFLKPVYAGDTITYVSVVKETRPVSRPGFGLVVHDMTGTNQNGDVVYSVSGAVFVERRDK